MRASDAKLGLSVKLDEAGEGLWHSRNLRSVRQGPSILPGIYIFGLPSMAVSNLHSHTSSPNPQVCKNGSPAEIMDPEPPTPTPFRREVGSGVFIEEV